MKLQWLETFSFRDGNLELNALLSSLFFFRGDGIRLLQQTDGGDAG